MTTQWKDGDGTCWGMEDSIEDVKSRFVAAYLSWLRFRYEPYAGPRTQEELDARLLFLSNLKRHEQTK